MTRKNVARDLERATVANAAPPAPARNAGRFEMRPDGLWKRGGGDDRPDMWICGPFEVLAETRDAEQGAWGLLMQWPDRDGHTHQEILPRAMFTGEGQELRSKLSDGGLSLTPTQAARQALLEYLAAIITRHRARCVAQVGWHVIGGRRIFALPDETIGTCPERVVVHTGSKEPSPFGQAGTIAGWKGNIGDRCRGNSRLVLAACCGFAPPLFHLIGERGGGIHLHGKSSSGKTTLLRVAASVCGGTAEAGASGYVKTWRSTGNAVEATASAHSDALLPLDEIAEADPRELGVTAYMLGNGQGKARLDRGAALRAPLRFRVLFLSTGESSLEGTVAEAGKRVQAGMTVRMIDLPVETGHGGVFESWRQDGAPAKLAQALNEASRLEYGTVFRGFLRMLVAQLDENPDLADDLQKAVADRVGQWIEEDADPQVRSVARRLALIAEAGEMATTADLTGWPPGEADKGMHVCFRAWLNARGGIGAREDMEAVERLRRFMALNASARFADWRDLEQSLTDGSTLPPPERMRIINRAGFRRWDEDQQGGGHWTYFLHPAGINEVLKELSFRPAVKALVAAGLIIPDKYGKSSQLQTVPGQGKQRLYEVAADIGADGSDDQPASG